MAIAAAWLRGAVLSAVIYPAMALFALVWLPAALRPPGGARDRRDPHRGAGHCPLGRCADRGQASVLPRYPGARQRAGAAALHHEARTHPDTLHRLVRAQDRLRAGRSRPPRRRRAPDAGGRRLGAARGGAGGDLSAGHARAAGRGESLQDRCRRALSGTRSALRSDGHQCRPVLAAKGDREAARSGRGGVSRSPSARARNGCVHEPSRAGDRGPLERADRRGALARGRAPSRCRLRAPRDRPRGYRGPRADPCGGPSR